MNLLKAVYVISVVGLLYIFKRLTHSSRQSAIHRDVHTSQSSGQSAIHRDVHTSQSSGQSRHPRGCSCLTKFMADRLPLWMAVTRHLSSYILLQRLRRPIPSWPYRLHGAPAPSALPTHTHPSLPCDTCASAERAKPTVLHVGVERIGNGAALWLSGSCP